MVCVECVSSVVCGRVGRVDGEATRFTKAKEYAPSGNRTRGISMATRYFTTKPTALVTPTPNTQLHKSPKNTTHHHTHKTTYTLPRPTHTHTIHTRNTTHAQRTRHNTPPHPPHTTKHNTTLHQQQLPQSAPTTKPNNHTQPTHKD